MSPEGRACSKAASPSPPSRPPGQVGVRSLGLPKKWTSGCRLSFLSQAFSSRCFQGGWALGQGMCLSSLKFLDCKSRISLPGPHPNLGAPTETCYKIQSGGRGPGLQDQTAHVGTPSKLLRRSGPQLPRLSNGSKHTGPRSLVCNSETPDHFENPPKPCATHLVAKWTQMEARVFVAFVYPFG